MCDDCSMLFVLLHGHDATPATLAEPLQVLTGIKRGDVLAFEGRCVLPNGNRAWWDDGSSIVGVHAAVASLRAEIGSALAQRDLGWNELVLIGFSQGASLAVGLACDGHSPSPGWVVCVAGFPPDGCELEHAAMRGLLVLHGTHDDVVDPMYGRIIARSARKVGVVVAEATHDGGHAWTVSCSEAVVRWLQGSVAFP